MRFRNTVIALVLLAIVGGYAIVVFFYSKPAPTPKLVSVKPKEVASVTLEYPSRASDKLIELARTRGGNWRITKPIGAEASEDVVNNLVRAVARASVDETVDEKPKDLKPYGLEPPQAIVTLTTFDGKRLPAIDVGKATPVGFHAYVKTSAKPAVMLTSSAFPSGMNKTVDQLRNREIMSFQIDKVRRLTLAKDNGKLIEVDRKGDQWRIVKPADYPADPTQVRELLSTLDNARAADFIADAPASVTQYGLEKPHLTVTVYTGKAGAEQSLLFGFKQSEAGKDGIYVRRGESTPVYTVHQYVLNGVDKSVLALRDKTVMGFEPSKVESADVQVGADHFALRRAPQGKWDLVEGAKTTPADVPVVERFLDELRDLKGLSIVADPMPSPVPFGLDHPTVQVTLVGKDGKPIGTYKLSKISVQKSALPVPGESNAPHDEYYATSTAGTAVYSLSDFIYTQFDKPPALFRARVAAAHAPAAAKK
jgi:Domain of unknown function (DUF4340)